MLVVAQPDKMNIRSTRFNKSAIKLASMPIFLDFTKAGCIAANR